MKIEQLLQYRDALLRQAHVANLAYAYQRLRDLSDRLALVGLRGAVTLRLGDPTDEESVPQLLSDEDRQAVIDEHFVDEDVADLANIFGFLINGRPATELRFKLEDIAEHFLPRLRDDLVKAEVELDDDAPARKHVPDADIAGADADDVVGI